MSLQSSAFPVSNSKPKSRGPDIDVNLDTNLNKRKRTQHPSACVPCRSRKSKCDGNRLEPCSSCSKRKTNCVYELGVGETRISKLRRENNTLQDEVAGYQSIIDLIRSSTEEEAAELFKRIRHSSTADEAMGLIRAAASLMNSGTSDTSSPGGPHSNIQPVHARTTSEDKHKEPRPMSRLTERNLAQQERLEQPRPISYQAPRILLPKLQPHDDLQTSPNSCSPCSVPTQEPTSASPPGYYALPRPSQPTPYGGMPYTATKDTFPPRSVQLIEPDRTSQRLPPLFSSSYHGAPVLPPLMGLDRRSSVPSHRQETGASAQGFKPLHVWPENAAPRYPTYAPL